MVGHIPLEDGILVRVQVPQLWWEDEFSLVNRDAFREDGTLVPLGVAPLAIAIMASRVQVPQQASEGKYAATEHER